MMAYIVVRKHIAGGKESISIVNAYTTREDANEKVMKLAKNAGYHHLRFYVVAKQLRGKVNVP